jgi:hypothetical protein
MHGKKHNKKLKSVVSKYMNRNNCCYAVWKSNTVI